MRSLRLTLGIFLAPLLAYPVAFARLRLLEILFPSLMAKSVSDPTFRNAPGLSLALAYALTFLVGIPTFLILSRRRRLGRRSLEAAGALIGGLVPGVWMLIQIPDLLADDPRVLYMHALRLLAGILSGYLIGLVIWHLGGETLEAEAPAQGSAAAFLTVLYDGRCALCRRASSWLAKQPKYVSMAFVDAGSEEARRRFPSLDAGATLEELTVVGSRGEVYRGSKAWVMCLWALRRYRSAALRLAAPGMEPVARRLVAWVSRNRFRIGEAAGWTR